MVRLDSTGQRLRWLRMRKGITQINAVAEIERETGAEIAQNYLSALENDNARPTFAVMIALARYYDVSLDYLATLIDDIVAIRRDEMAPVYSSAEADEAARIIDALPAWSRAEVVALIRHVERLTANAAMMQRREFVDMFARTESSPED